MIVCAVNVFNLFLRCKITKDLYHSFYQYYGLSYNIYRFTQLL